LPDAIAVRAVSGDSGNGEAQLMEMAIAHPGQTTNHRQKSVRPELVEGLCAHQGFDGLSPSGY